MRGNNCLVLKQQEKIDNQKRNWELTQEGDLINEQIT